MITQKDVEIAKALRVRIDRIEGLEMFADVRNSITYEEMRVIFFALDGFIDVFQDDFEPTVAPENDEPKAGSAVWHRQAIREE